MRLLFFERGEDVKMRDDSRFQNSVRFEENPVSYGQVGHLCIMFLLFLLLNRHFGRGNNTISNSVNTTR